MTLLAAICSYEQSTGVIKWLVIHCLPLGFPSAANGAWAVLQISQANLCGERQATLKTAQGPNMKDWWARFGLWTAIWEPHVHWFTSHTCMGLSMMIISPIFIIHYYRMVLSLKYPHVPYLGRKVVQARGFMHDDAYSLRQHNLTTA